MRFLWKSTPSMVLRLGLGLMYLYSGLDHVRYPADWSLAIGALPAKFQGFISQIDLDAYLRFQGIAELVLAAVFLLWFLPRRFVFWAAFLAAIETVLAFWLFGVVAVSFRGFAVLGAALALWLMYWKRR